MRRIGKRLGGLALAGIVDGPPARVRAPTTPLAGSRPRLRADRQGRRDARGPGQAAGHRGPRRGQADLRPRDDQAPRPERRDRKDPRPGRPRSQDRRRMAVEKWGPVGAFLGWTVNPEFWDDQPFILAEYLPLRRRIVADTLATRLKAIADKSTTPADEKASLKARRRHEPTAAGLTAYLRGSKLPLEDKKTIAETKSLCFSTDFHAKRWTSKRLYKFI